MNITTIRYIKIEVNGNCDVQKLKDIGYIYNEKQNSWLFKGKVHKYKITIKNDTVIIILKPYRSSDLDITLSCLYRLLNDVVNNRALHVVKEIK